jgi:hypothetical protein
LVNLTLLPEIGTDLELTCARHQKPTPGDSRLNPEYLVNELIALAATFDCRVVADGAKETRFETSDTFVRARKPMPPMTVGAVASG